MTWGAVQPKDLPQARLRLDFGLRPAILAFNEWAVPGLGGAFFVRQLTWACMGLRLAQEADTNATPARVAEALEALASWIVIRGVSERIVEPRVQGKRKLRGRTGLAFRDVAQRGAYVTVPFRRSATRALPGLGFCVREEARFSALELGPAGIELAESAFAAARDADRAREVDPRRSVMTWIEQGDTPMKKVHQPVKNALDPREASDEEKRLVRKQVLSEARRAALAELLQVHSDGDLATAAGRRDFLAQVPDRAHAVRLATCFAFEELRAAALRAAQAIGDAIAAGAQEAQVLQQHADVVDAFAVLGGQCDALLRGLGQDAPAEAHAFCREQGSGQRLDERIVALATRVPLVFSVLGSCIDQGLGFTRKPLVADDAYDPGENEEAPPPLGVPQPLLRLRRLLADAEVKR